MYWTRLLRWLGLLPPATPLPSAEVLKIQLDALVDLAEKGEIHTAVSQARRLKMQAPTDVEVLQLLVDLLIQSDQPGEAADILEEILTLQPSSNTHFGQLADLYLDLERPQRVIELATARVENFPEARLWLSDAWLMAGQGNRALEVVREFIALDPEDHRGLTQLGSIHFRLLDYTAASQALGLALERDPHNADGWWTLGLVRERLGDDEGAREALEQARELDPATYPSEQTLYASDIETLAETIILALPDRLRHYLVNVPISVEELPSDDDLRSSDPPFPPDLLGLFRGPNLRESHPDQPVSGGLPAEIVLFRRNLARLCCDQEELMEEVRITLEHEIAHYLGLNEEEVAALGLE